jgi:hypothetical protein
LFTVSKGSILGGENEGTCAPLNSKATSTKTYVWTAPNSDGGEIAFDAMCGHSNAMVRAAQGTSAASAAAQITSATTTTTTTNQSQALSVGNLVDIIGGRYKGQVGTVHSLHPKTATIKLSSGTVTGYIPYRDLQKQPATTTTVTTKTTTTTITTTTIFDPGNVDCVEEQDPCTAVCQRARARNHAVLTPVNKLGKVCIGPTDCQPGEGACPTTASSTTTNCATYGIVGEDTCAEVCPI